jgi:eukaryotic-like serine/threonine-protein kinase
MPAPTTIDEFLQLVRKSGVLEDSRLDAHIDMLRAAGELPSKPPVLAKMLVRDGILTTFQSAQIVQGRWRRFTIGKYLVLERLGSGGMGSVFLCEHKFMRRRVAVKVLPTAKAKDESSLQRFYREARAVAAVDHPNIVHAYDIDQDENLHFIVMEYVDGPSFQEIVTRSGPLGLERACHYISQAAQGLGHANTAGLVHRDIKPGNILVDRAGVVKILDMGLARFFNDEEDLLTRKYDENVLGTADYLAPEQADDSHDVDIRADIYSLGGTFNFLLTGKTPFGEGSVPQKLMWHRTRQPKPVNAYRDDVPQEVQAVLDKMMAKEPEKRFQLPSEISAALSPWTKGPVPPPSESELPHLSLAAAGASGGVNLPKLLGNSGLGLSSEKKSWQVNGATPEPKQQTDSAVKTRSNRGATPASAATEESGAEPNGREPAVASPSPGLAAAQLPSRQAATVPNEEETAPWSETGPDTADATAKGDTPPLTPGRLRSVPKNSVLPKKVGRGRLLIVLFAAFALVMLGVGFGSVSLILRLLGRW